MKSRIARILGIIAVATAAVVTIAPTSMAAQEPSSGYGYIAGATVIPASVVKDIFRGGELPPLTRPVSDPEQTGVEPSAYVGPGYRAKDEDIRKCLLRREANGHYGAVGASGTYRGGYQSHPDLVRGMTYHIRDAIIDAGVPASIADSLTSELRDIPMNRWAREWQDAAFWTTFNYDGVPRSGAHHWGTFGQTYACVK